MNPHQRCLQAKVKYRNEPKTGNAKVFKDCAKRPISQLLPSADIVALGKYHQYESKTVEEEFLFKMKVLSISRI